MEGCLLWGVSVPGGSVPGGCLLQGMSAPGGGVCSWGVCIPACTEADTPSVNRITGACKNITLAQLCCGR